jgi:hypothetical protein
MILIPALPSRYEKRTRYILGRPLIAEKATILDMQTDVVGKPNQFSVEGVLTRISHHSYRKRLFPVA